MRKQDRRSDELKTKGMMRVREQRRKEENRRESKRTEEKVREQQRKEENSGESKREGVMNVREQIRK